MKKHAEIKDIEKILKRTFINKNGEKVWLRSILKDKANSHIADENCKLMDKPLYNRFYKFLKNKNDWIDISTLRSSAYQGGYNGEQIQKALSLLDTCVDIGYSNHKYHWYKVKNKKARKKTLEWFEQL